MGDSRRDEKNGLGELIKTTDAMNGTITYTYDAVGNTLTTTTDGPTKAAGVAGAITVSMTYGPDNHARWKTSMNDPDKGHWQYRYNAFGEVIEQIDARGRSTVTHRDNLGREVCRVDYLDASHSAVESSSQWFYDTAPKPDNGNGQTTAIGQLHRVVKSNTACNGTPSYDANSQYDYEQVYHYDAFGRNHMTDTLIDGETFTTKVTYDELGRTFQSFDAAGNDRGTRNIYNDQGYLSEIRDVQVYNNAQAVYRKILEMDARGNVTQEFSHNGMTTTRAYDPIHGMITEIYTALEGVLIAQDMIMHYDALGNLLRRDDNKRGHYESFCYDALNRMTGSGLNAQCTEGDIQYDSFGNFISKPNVGTYTYGEQAGPHAVTSTEKDGVITTYQYDANGNMVSDSTGRQLIYSQFDKPTQITKGQNTIEFDYGPGRSRYKRTDTEDENTTTTLYLGNVEIITRNGVREAKRYIAGNTISTDTALNEAKAPQTASFQFMFKDHLGSLDIILTETPNEADGQILMSFDAWGLRRNATTLDDGFNLAEIINQSISATTRGFTGHEMLDLVGLIHMNGRVYDPLLGRFLSADPFIQSPTETQSYNRYAYVWNNPLSSTDPTGYWDNRKMMGVFGSILQIVGTLLIWTPFGMPLVMIGGAMVGKAQGNIMRGVVTAAFTAIATAGIAAAAQAATAANTALHCAKGVITIGKLSLTAAQWGARILAQSVVGGVASAMQGGNFGNGFVSAGISSGLSIAIPSTGNFAVGMIRSAAIGGTVSELTGGKFANGARMGAYSYAASYGTAKAAESNSPEAKFNRLIASGKNEDLMKAAALAIDHFGIDTSSVNKIYYSSLAGDLDAYAIADQSNIAGFSEVGIGPGSRQLNFSEFGSMLGHEIEYHGSRNTEGLRFGQAYDLDELGAWQYELDNAYRFGISADTVNYIQRQRTYYYNRLNDQYKSLADKGIYDAD